MKVIKINKDKERGNDLIIMTVLQQIEVDLDSGEYEPLVDMLKLLIKKKGNRKILIKFLNDEIVEYLKNEGVII